MVMITLVQSGKFADLMLIVGEYGVSIIFRFVVLTLAAFLAACGGSGGGNGNDGGGTTQNRVPTANTTGTQRDVFFDDTAILDGSTSSDPDGDTLTYQWTQTSGPPVSLANSTNAQASFIVPNVLDGVVRVFELVVNDGTSNSAAASVVVVSHQYPIPIGDATADITMATEGQLITLDGTGSSDPQGDPLTYQWTQTAGPGVQLSDDTIAKPTFTASDVVSDETLTFKLIVMNARRSSSPVTVNIEVSNTTGVLVEFPNPLANSFERFAESIAAIDNNMVLVGVPGHGDGSSNIGLAYIIDLSSETVVDIIESPEETTDKSFGKHVAVMPNGDYAISSMNNGGVSDDAGSVFIFDATTRNLKLTLNHPDPNSADNFGESFAVLPNGQIAVGASSRNIASGSIFNSAGIVYLFDPATCDAADGVDGFCSTVERTINHPDIEENDYFGGAIAATPTGNLVTSAYGHTVDSEAGAGTVYVIDPNTGNLIFSIDNPQPAASDWFGSAVSVTSTGNIIIGAYRDDGSVTNSGKVYVFDDNGTELLTLEEPSLSDGARFGWAVASDSSDNIVVGAPVNEIVDPMGGDSLYGSVFVFDAISGALLDSINNPLSSEIANSGFGGSISVPPSGDLFVGAPQAGDSGNVNLPQASGAVYLIEGQ